MRFTIDNISLLLACPLLWSGRWSNLGSSLIQSQDCAELGDPLLINPDSSGPWPSLPWERLPWPLHYLMLFYEGAVSLLSAKHAGSVSECWSPRILKKRMPINQRRSFWWHNLWTGHCSRSTQHTSSIHRLLLQVRGHSRIHERHSVVNDFFVWVIVLVPKKAQVVEILFINIEIVEHLFYIGHDGNLLSPEPHQNTNEAVCEVRPSH